MGGMNRSPGLSPTSSRATAFTSGPSSSVRPLSPCSPLFTRAANRIFLLRPTTNRHSAFRLRRPVTTFSSPLPLLPTTTTTSPPSLSPSPGAFAFGIGFDKATTAWWDNHNYPKQWAECVVFSLSFPLPLSPPFFSRRTCELIGIRCAASVTSTLRRSKLAASQC